LLRLLLRILTEPTASAETSPSSPERAWLTKHGSGLRLLRLLLWLLLIRLLAGPGGLNATVLKHV
jgi:hypothetical protein